MVLNVEMREVYIIFVVGLVQRLRFWQHIYSKMEIGIQVANLLSNNEIHGDTPCVIVEVYIIYLTMKVNIML